MQNNTYRNKSVLSKPLAPSASASIEGLLKRDEATKAEIRRRWATALEILNATTLDDLFGKSLHQGRCGSCRTTIDLENSARLNAVFLRAIALAFYD